jgi:hypothetical protein
MSSLKPYGPIARQLRETLAVLESQLFARDALIEELRHAIGQVQQDRDNWRTLCEAKDRAQAEQVQTAMNRTDMKELAKRLPGYEKAPEIAEAFVAAAEAAYKAGYRDGERNMRERAALACNDGSELKYEYQQCADAVRGLEIEDPMGGPMGSGAAPGRP